MEQDRTVGLHQGGRPKTGLLENPVFDRPALASQGQPVRLIFNTAKYQGIDYKRQSALEKRLGTTFC
jgi:hypothetical protein